MTDELLRAECEAVADMIYNCINHDGKWYDRSKVLSVVESFAKRQRAVGLREAVKLCSDYSDRHWRDPNLFLDGKGAGAESCALECEARAKEYES